MKKRLDLLLLERGLFSSRNKAQAAIRKGEVTVEGEIVKTPAAKISFEAPIKVESQDPYPGRGGVKLNGALEDLDFDPEGMIVLDGGASTGGFTACLLERGAKKIYAVDVGSNQMVPELRQDPRVVVIENYNLRYFSSDLTREQLDLIVLDLSFISATKVIPNLVTALKEGGFFLTLVKPQFEVGPQKVGKRGLVPGEEDQYYAVKKVVETKLKNGLGFIGIAPSRLAGVRGNQEYFLLMQKGGVGEFTQFHWVECQAKLR